MMRTLALTIATLTSPLLAQTVGSLEPGGLGCPNERIPTLMEGFGPGDLDLSGKSLTFTRQFGGFYDVTEGGTVLPYGTVASQAIQAGQDDVLGPFPLGFSFPVYGAQTVTDSIRVSSNGYIYLESESDEYTFRPLDDSQIYTWFRREPANIAVLGDDFDPSLTTGSGNIWLDSGPSAVWITWDSVPEVGAPGSSNTFQVQLHADGSFQIHWIQVANQTDLAVVGYAANRTVLDTYLLDFSTLTSWSFPGSIPVGYAPFIRNDVLAPTTGLTLELFVDRVPASVQFGGLMFGTESSTPLTPIGAETCTLLTPGEAATLPLAIAAPTASWTLAIPDDPSLDGFSISAQAAFATAEYTSIGLVFSDRCTMTVGSLSPVVVTAIGEHAAFDRGFMRILNLTDLQITSVKLRWPSFYWQTDWDLNGIRLDSGNTTLLGCPPGTYGDNSDVTTGLDYASTDPVVCDPSARLGYIPLEPVTLQPNRYRSLEFPFTDFDPGEEFVFDAYRPLGSSNQAGGTYSSLQVTVTFSDGSVRSGTMRYIDPLQSRADI